MNCRMVEEKLALHLYDELPPEERAAVDAHLTACPACAAAAAELGRLHAALDQRPALEPTPELFVQSRAELEEALDREARGWRGLLHSGWGLWPMGSPFRWTAALAILLVGVSLGWGLHQRVGEQPTSMATGTPPWIGADMNNMRISGISQVTPDPQTGQVRITLDAERRVTLSGSLDDPRIREILVRTVKSYDNAGIRHETLNVLSGRAEEPAIREALLYAVRHDPNAGVRLEALNAVQELTWTPDVQEAVLGALETDANPGVRVAAVNLLLRHRDPQLLPALQKLAVNDSNPYVRLKCANAVREQTPHDF